MLVEITTYPVSLISFVNSISTDVRTGNDVTESYDIDVNQRAKRFTNFIRITCGIIIML